MTEQERDTRDLDILADLANGVNKDLIALEYYVTLEYIEALEKEATDG